MGGFFYQLTYHFKDLMERQTSETHQSAGCQDNSFCTYTCSLYSQVQEP